MHLAWLGEEPATVKAPSWEPEPQLGAPPVTCPTAGTQIGTGAPSEGEPGAPTEGERGERRAPSVADQHSPTLSAPWRHPALHALSPRREEGDP